MDGNINRKPGEKNLAHPHSNVARKIAYRHIVGVIGDRKVQENVFQVDERDINEINKNTKGFKLSIVSPSG